MMGATVWPYQRAECDDCQWQGPWHLSPVSAQDDADVHNEHHAQAAAIEAMILGGLS